MMVIISKTAFFLYPGCTAILGQGRVGAKALRPFGQQEKIPFRNRLPTTNSRLSLDLFTTKADDGESSMQQPIVGYHLDEFDDWVAELQCGHFQHVRHNPPMSERLWVLAEEGRNKFLGYPLACKKCAQGAPRDDTK